MELIKTEFSDLGGLLKIIEDRIVFVGTLKYWECVRCLLSNDDVGFEKRERQGAKDLVNCLLNYGYAIIYARCWQALLAAQLNPYVNRNDECTENGKLSAQKTVTTVHRNR